MMSALQSHQSAANWAAAYPDNPNPQSFGQLLNQESTYTGRQRMQDAPLSRDCGCPFRKLLACTLQQNVRCHVSLACRVWNACSAAGDVFLCAAVPTQKRLAAKIEIRQSPE